VVGDVVWSRKKQVRDRPTGMRLMDRSRELSPLQRHGEAYRKERIYAIHNETMWVVERG